MIKGVSIYKPKRRNRKSDPWLISYGPRNDRKVVTASPDRQVTNELAIKLARMSERIKHGLLTKSEARHEEYIVVGIERHVADFVEYLKGKNAGKKHVNQTKNTLNELMSGIAFMSDIIPARLQTKIGKMDLAGRSKNHYVSAYHSFLKWGSDEDRRWSRAFADEIRLKTFPNIKKHERRILTVDELNRLIHTAETTGNAQSVPGKERSLIYRLAIISGLRAGELERLTIDDIKPNGIIVRAESAKNRTKDTVAVPAEMIAEIQKFYRDNSRSGKIFKFGSSTARMISIDLKRAGIPRKTADGFFDFHSLRHQSGSLLIGAGLDLKSVQKHMRHKTMKMTTDTYGHQLESNRSLSAQIMASIGQRMAQRKDVLNSPILSNKGITMSHSNSGNGDISSESGNSRLSENQLPNRGIALKNGRIHSHRRGELAPGAAQKVLSAFYRRAIRRSPASPIGGRQ